LSGQLGKAFAAVPGTLSYRHSCDNPTADAAIQHAPAAIHEIVRALHPITISRDRQPAKAAIHAAANGASQNFSVDREADFTCAALIGRKELRKPGRTVEAGCPSVAPARTSGYGNESAPGVLSKMKKSG
jgi:hypothetical protein